ncbi:MAG TPA: hypothetical protein VG015_05715, partial [Candidatus Dormibacteraeota bacterium]|nr:hypothetical protein [Candidatus Dormibacteraeota bacterium]
GHIGVALPVGHGYDREAFLVPVRFHGDYGSGHRGCGSLADALAAPHRWFLATGGGFHGSLRRRSEPTLADLP